MTKSSNFLFFKWDEKASLRVTAVFSVFPLIFWLMPSSYLSLCEFLISLKTSIIFSFDWDSKRSSLNFLMISFKDWFCSLNFKISISSFLNFSFALFPAFFSSVLYSVFRAPFNVWAFVFYNPISTVSVIWVYFVLSSK